MSNTTHPSVPLSVYFVVFGALMVGTALTVAVAYVDLGVFNTIVALTIACIKALLVLLYFMHLRYTSKLTWAFAATGFVWLTLIIGLTMSDIVSRNWIPAQPF
jgi:cytochrome c oxidase subunit 4